MHDLNQSVQLNGQWYRTDAELADSIRRAAEMLDMATADLCETVDRPTPNVRGARGWTNAALAVLAPYRTARSKDSPPSVHHRLYSPEDKGRAQDVLIFLSEHAEIVVPKPGVLPGVMDPEHELAVVRVEVLDGDVRVLIWDRRTLECAGEALVIPLTPTSTSTTF